MQHEDFLWERQFDDSTRALTQSESASQRLLFICGKNRWRSPTAEDVFSEYEGLDVSSAGLDGDAEVPLCGAAIQNADILFVMEPSQRRKLSQKFGATLKHKRVICLDIPDRYRYMEPELVELLKRKVLPLLGTCC